MKKIKVLIVEAFAPARQIATQMLHGEDDILVVGTAADASEARTQIKALDPDVIVLALDLPEDASLALIETTLARKPLPIIISAPYLPEYGEAAMRALELGAFDIVERPQNINDLAKVIAIQEKLRKLIRATQEAYIVASKPSDKRPRILHFKAKRDGLPIIAIGAATGGMAALRTITAQMPTIAPPMIIAQQLPQPFIRAFAQRLDSQSLLTVVEATQGARLHNGYAFVVPANKRLTVKKVDDYFICQLADITPRSLNTLDTLFNSIAHEVGRNAIGVVLSGVGSDGAAGLLNMRKKGAHTIAQDVMSCMAYEMPEAATEAGAVVRQLPLAQIAKHLLEASNKRITIEAPLKPFQSA